MTLAAPPISPVPLLAMVGPTGTGKTRAAVALAAELPIEVVSADSRQVYRGMDIGTSKPTPVERAAVPHHLLDVVAPDDVYDAARFVRDASAAIDAIVGRRRLPVLVGGTGLYYRALVRGLQPRPPSDPALRESLRAEGREAGAEALYRRLEALDREAAARLHPRDAVRITRALEVALLGGGAAPAASPGSWTGDGQGSRYRLVTVGLNAERESLYRALDARVDRMLEEGLLDEVRRLLAAGYDAALPAMQGIGYRHLVPVAGRGAPLATAVAAMKRDTRRYAKRQWTWFAREPGVTWLSTGPDEPEPVAVRIKRIVDLTRIFDYSG